MITNKFTVTRENLIKRLIFVLPIFALMFVSACQQGEESNANNSSSAVNVAENKLTDFEKDLAYVRSFNFNFVYAFRRTDGDVLSGDDKGFINANIPAADANQRVVTADGKCAIIGSNFKFAPVKLDALKKRFSVEDYSPVLPADNANQTAANSIGNQAAINNKQKAANANQNTAKAK